MSVYIDLRLYDKIVYKRLPDIGHEKTYPGLPFTLTFLFNPIDYWLDPRYKKVINACLPTRTR